MPDKNWIQQLVERVVSQALESHIPYLRDDLVRRVIQELQPALASAPGDAAAPQASANGLMKAISSIHNASTQKEILSALLEGACQFCGRTALFVIRSGAAVGWQGRGFAKNDAVKNFPLDLSTGISAQALQGEKPSNGTVADIDARLISALGTPADDRVIMLPLIIKEKVAALLYADAGTDAAGGAPRLAVPADTTVALKPIKLNLSPYSAPIRKPPPRPCLVPWKWGWQPQPVRVAQKQQPLRLPPPPIARKFIAKPNASPNY